MFPKVISVLIVLIVINQVLSQPDLCTNPKLDTIAWVDNLQIWFFTSGGYYWYLKEKDFPPKQPMGKLPAGFVKGDGAAYRDWLKVCKTTKFSNKPDQQLIYLVEKTSAGNEIIEFDISDRKWANESHPFNSDRIIGRVKIEDSNEKIDSMFTFKDEEIYVVQGTKYAGVNWKNLCDKPNEWAVDYGGKDVDHLQGRLTFDAIAVVGDVMYQFLGTEYWMGTNMTSQSGQITLTRSIVLSISKDFFKFKECPTNIPPVVGDTPQDPTQTSDNSDGNNHQKNDGVNEGSSGTGIAFIIVVVVVLALIIGLIIGAVFFALRKKAVPSQKSESKAVSTKTAIQPSKVTGTVPSKVTGTVPSKVTRTVPSRTTLASKSRTTRH